MNNGLAGMEGWNFNTIRRDKNPTRLAHKSGETACWLDETWHSWEPFWSKTCWG